MKKTILGTFLCVLLIICLSISIKQCSTINHEYKNNIEALTDSIHYYKAKDGKQVATIHGYETNIKNLKYLNDSLYKEIKSLNIKNNKVVTTTQFSGVITNELHDTIYTIQHDTIYKGFYKDFNFNNQYRILEGNVNYQHDSLGINILKDQIMFDYTVVMDKDNVIHIKSNNPYVKYSNISGYIVPKPKKKRWSVGPSIGYSYDIRKNTFSPTVGVSLQYGLIQW